MHHANIVVMGESPVLQWTWRPCWVNVTAGWPHVRSKLRLTYNSAS